MTNETDGWNDFIGGNFLKAIDVDSDKDGWVVLKTNIIDGKEGKKSLRVTLMRNAIEKEFDLNKTNSAFIKNAGVLSPRNLIGKTLYFKKALVRNPTTNKEVEGLRVCKVE